MRRSVLSSTIGPGSEDLLSTCSNSIRIIDGLLFIVELIVLIKVYTHEWGVAPLDRLDRRNLALGLQARSEVLARSLLGTCGNSGMHMD